LATIKSALDCDAQVVIDAQHEPSPRRLQWLQARTGRPWTAARLAHVEGLTFVAIRRALQSRGLFSSDLRASASPR
jgi:hypothetical protein